MALHPFSKPTNIDNVTSKVKRARNDILQYVLCSCKKTFKNDLKKNVFDERKSDLDELHFREWRSDIGRWRGKSFLEECALAQ